MKKFRPVSTEICTDYCGYEFAVVKVIQTVEGAIEQTTHYFNNENEAQDKFLAIVTKEANHIRRKSNRAGYNTDKIIEIEALTDEQILDSYGTYDELSGNIVTQILLMRNPKKGAA